MQTKACAVNESNPAMRVQVYCMETFINYHTSICTLHAECNIFFTISVHPSGAGIVWRIVRPFPPSGSSVSGYIQLAILISAYSPQYVESLGQGCKQMSRFPVMEMSTSSVLYLSKTLPGWAVTQISHSKYGCKILTRESVYFLQSSSERTASIFFAPALLSVCVT